MVSVRLSLFLRSGEQCNLDVCALSLVTTSMDAFVGDSNNSLLDLVCIRNSTIFTICCNNIEAGITANWGMYRHILTTQ